MSLTRRSLLKNAGGLASLSMFADPALAAILRQGPELILHNGHVLTMDPRQPQAEAIAIAGGRILAVGSKSKSWRLGRRPDEESRPRRQDRRSRLHRRALPPRLLGPAAPAVHRLRPALHKPRSRTRSASVPQRRRPANGSSASSTTTPRPRRSASSRARTSTPPRRNTRSTSRTAAGTPATSIRSALQSRASRSNRPTPRAGSSSATRRPAGSPAGCSSARRRSTSSRSRLSARPARRGSRSRQADSAMLAKAGVTSSTDAYGSPDDLRAYQDAREAGEFASRIYCMVGYPHLDRMLASGVRTGLGDDWVRVGGMKATCDGSISERTARLSQPYVGRPDDFGIIVADAEELYSLARKAHEAGWQLGIHANGDVGIGIVLGVYERLQREQPRRDPRFRIEHCTLDQRRAGAANEGTRRDSNAVLDLRVLPRREDAGVRRGAAQLHVRAAQRSSTPASGRRWPRIIRPAPSSR